jgi:hypothetical protein
MGKLTVRTRTGYFPVVRQPRSSRAAASAEGGSQ